LTKETGDFTRNLLNYIEIVLVWCSKVFQGKKKKK